MQAQQVPKKLSTIGVIKRQLSYFKLKKYRGCLPLIIINCIFSAALPVVLVFFPKYIISLISAGSSFRDILYMVLLFSGISVICIAVTTYISSKEIYMYMRIRMDQFSIFNQKMKEIDYSYLEDAHFRDKSNTASTALAGNNMGFEKLYHDAHNILPLFLQILVFSVIICFLHFSILIALLVGTLISALINISITKYIDKNKDERSRTIRQKHYYYQTLYDFAYGKDIRVYDLKQRLSKEYKVKSYNYLTVVKNIHNKKFGLGLLELIMLLIQDGLAYFFIVFGYFKGKIDLSEVALFIGIVIALSSALRSVSELIFDINECAQYSKDYFLFMDDKSYYSHKGSMEALSQNETLEVEFKNVSFKYPNTDNYILKNFNFKIDKKMRLAIVGTNGAGKTTIIKLLTGLFSVTEGDIFVNGINIKDFDIVQYQKMFGVVFQDINIFAGSILENIVGSINEQTDIPRALSCCREVGLEEKILSLPNKYETQLLKVIDENGIQLSGGENQKLAIARALYKRANMIVLDEPTSALDALTEAKIYEDFDKLIKDKTAIYVSHRLSSTKFCDKIAFFDSEGLKEYGTHDELMARNGLYASMFNIQGKYYQEEVRENEEN
jgi:ATP-binding cassette subfamily B protein/ATP-binding cassette subfamily C protein